MKKVLALVIFISIGHFSMAQFNLGKIKKALTGESLSAEEVGRGLKEALEKGVSQGTDIVSQLDGYYKNPQIKIPFPPDVQKVETRLRQLGLDEQVDKFILSLNRAAEDAAKEAKPIFISAIKQMTIEDAWAILKGEDDAATQYLKKTTSRQLFEKFQPIVRASLEKVDATKYYSDLINTYNKIPLVEDVNPDLDEYATNKAIDGLFVMIAKEEKEIRENPAARTTDILKRVFNAQ